MRCGAVDPVTGAVCQKEDGLSHGDYHRDDHDSTEVTWSIKPEKTLWVPR
jgi:hypothetical protein